MTVQKSIATKLATDPEVASVLSDPRERNFVDIVFDGPPSHEGARFIEVEDSRGNSICFAQWVQREDGYWALRLTPDKYDLPHYHAAGTMAGLHIDTCAHCAQDLRSDIHRSSHVRPSNSEGA